MTIGARIRSLAPALVLVVASGVANPMVAAGEPASEMAVRADSDPYVATDARHDPRLRRTGDEERRLRQVGDAVFSRPVLFVRMVAGVAMLPVALPVAAVFADWRDALDFCVTGPYGMVFQRPLGE